MPPTKCRRATRTERRDVVETALARGLGSRRVRLRWYASDDALRGDVRRALATLAPPLGGREVLDAADALRGHKIVLQYGKFLVARGELDEAERARGSQFAHVVYLRPDAAYVGFSSDALDASTIFVLNDQFAAFGRQFASAYCAQVATALRIAFTNDRPGSCQRWNDLLAGTAPEWGWDALYHGACLRGDRAERESLAPRAFERTAARTLAPWSYESLLRDGLSWHD